MKRLPVVVVALAFLPALGCGSVMLHLQERAAFDLDCPKENLRISQLGVWSVQGVRGCGQRAVYVYIGGHWLLNTDGQQEVVQAAIIEEQEREAEEERRKREEEEKKRQEEEQKRREEERERQEEERRRELRFW